MPRPPVDIARKIKDILHHVELPPAEAASPFAHYRRSSNDFWNLREYVEEKLLQAPHYPAGLARHMHRLNIMVLVNMVETFERFLKETAAVCVDHLAKFVLDDRFNGFKILGASLAAHFDTDTLGKSLCESAIWLDCDEINARFRKLLADPFEDGTFFLFPQPGQQPKDEQDRHKVLSLLWQLRHTIVHNVGLLTRSDAVKLRLLVQEDVQSPRMLVPTRDDLRYVKRFLDETAQRTNERVGRRLAHLLSTLYL